MLERTEEALNIFAKQAIKSSRSNITRWGKNVSSALYRALGYDLETNPNSFSLSFTTGDDDLDYIWDYQDRGVSGKKVKHDTPYSFRNKMPPRKNILQWVNARRMRLRDEKGKFKKGGQNSLAFLIQRSIFNKGIKPSLFFTNPFEAAFKNLPPELEEAFALDVEDFIDFTFRTK